MENSDGYAKKGLILHFYGRLTFLTLCVGVANSVTGLGVGVLGILGVGATIVFVPLFSDKLEMNLGKSVSVAMDKDRFFSPESTFSGSLFSVISQSDEVVDN